MKYRICSFFLWLVFPVFLNAESALIDLEDQLSPFVLEVKKIEIPGYPDAFNPSIIRWKGRLLMSFRYLPDLKNKFLSCIGLILLDEEFNPVSGPEILPLKLFSGDFPSRAEDARLLYVGDKLMLVYSDCKEVKVSKGGFRVYISELKLIGDRFEPVKEICLSDYPDANPERREKNWVPFDYKGRLMFSYSIVPHTVFYSDQKSGRCDFISSTAKEVSWDWGELRGGTQALMLDETRYLSFFHSWKDMESVHSSGKTASHYFIGAYTYSAEPPFGLLEVSEKPIVGNNFYHGKDYKPYWKPVVAVFPCGYVMDDKSIWIVYGRQDHELWVARLNKRGLLKSLKSVE